MNIDELRNMMKQGKNAMKKPGGIHKEPDFPAPSSGQISTPVVPVSADEATVHYKRGRCFEDGINGYPQDDDKAFEKFKTAALKPEQSNQATTSNNSRSNGSNYVENKVIEIIADKLGVSQSNVHSNSSLTTDLGADSLDAIELIMEIEKEFNLTIPDEDAAGIRTVGDIVRYVQALI